MVYLIHFNEKLKHAQHYVGFTFRDLDSRIKQHKDGSGARIMEVLKQQGISWEVVRVWENGDRSFERRLKNTNNTKNYCPACNNGIIKKYTPKIK
jgi:predicted GIY-YIG superfamily endonuclease